jgi:translation initiation factor 4E
MSTATLPPAAAQANAQTLTQAMKAASISSSPSPNSEPVDLPEDESLEDGEIREEADDGKVKTVFDDASKFNVKVRTRSRRMLMGLAPSVFKLDAVL